MGLDDDFGMFWDLSIVNSLPRDYSANSPKKIYVIEEYLKDHKLCKLLGTFDLPNLAK